MDTSPASQSPEVSEPRAAFRKPSNVTSRRNYRRHSPSTSRSPSPPSTGGGWKRNRSPLSFNSQEDGRSKMADIAKRGRRLEIGREVDREFERTRGGRADDIYYDRRSEIQSRDRYRSDEYNHGRSQSNYYGRSYHSHASHSSRVSYANACSDYSRRDEYGRRSHRERGYDDYGRSNRETERSHRESGNDEIRDTDELKREREGDRNKDAYAANDGYKDQEGRHERDKLGGRYPDVDVDAILSREKGGDRRRYKDRDDRSRERERDKDKGKDYERYRDDKHIRDRHKDKDCRHERDRRRDRDVSKEHDWHKNRYEFKEQDQYRIKENFRAPVLSKEIEDKEREITKDNDDHNYRDYDRRKNDNGQDQKSGHRHDMVKDGSKSSGGRSREYEWSRERSSPGGDSGWMKASSNDKYHGDSSARGKEMPARGSSEATPKAESDFDDKEFRRLDLPTSDTHARSKETTTSASQEAGVKTHNHDVDLAADGKSGKNIKWGSEAQLFSERTSAASEAEVANDLNVARIAAMRAAELVNKNLGAGGFLSADQKKKLLWGSKKSVAEQPQEAATGNNRWDMARFTDPDRQEKFNKLMGVKGDLKVDQQSVEKGSGLFASEKQMELQQDLEKQFTAGMRRRDGRTVGLGL